MYVSKHKKVKIKNLTELKILTILQLTGEKSSKKNLKKLDKVSFKPGSSLLEW